MALYRTEANFFGWNSTEHVAIKLNKNGKSSIGNNGQGEVPKCNPDFKPSDENKSFSKIPGTHNNRNG
jgi:hypothetical protein